MSLVHQKLAPYAFALMLLSALAFWPALGGGFLFDDYPNIVQETRVHAATVDAQSLTLAASAYGGLRPLATMSFAIDHAIWGKDAWGYKLTNLLAHLFNAVLILLLVRRLLPLADRDRTPHLAVAFTVAALWAIHPLQVSTVSYVVQRMEILSLSFVLGALLCYLRGRQLQVAGAPGWPWLLACVPLVLVGLLSKETAGLFPAYALALELTVLGFAAQDAATSRRWRIAYATGTAVAMLALLLVVMPRYAPAEVYSIRNFDMVERLLTQLRVLPMYLGWIVLPQPASYHFYYDNYPVSHGLLQPVTTLLGGILLLALASLAVVVRRRVPLFSLGVLWFFAAHFLTSNVANLELVFEHRNYFAILGVVLALAALALRLPRSDVPRIRTFTAGVMIAGLLLLTLIRSATWGDPMTLAMTLSAKNPGSVRAGTDLAEQYMLLARKNPGSRFYVLSEKEFERAGALRDASPVPEQGLILLAATTGHAAKPEWWDRLVVKLQTRPIGPQELGMITSLLRIRDSGVELDDQRLADAYLVLGSRMSLPGGQYFAFGDHALRFLDDEKLAEQMFRKAVDNSRESPAEIAAMIEVLQTRGYPALARTIASYAQEIGVVTIDFGDGPPAAEAEPAPEAGTTD